MAGGNASNRLNGVDGRCGLQGDVIVTENLTRIYSDHGVPVRAVDNVSISIKSGEFTAIVGPSGSGKTTFLNIISGLDKPTEGKVWLSGKLLSELGGKELSDFRRDHIGFIFQAYNLIPVLTVEENIDYVMLLQGIGREERHQQVKVILSELGLEGFENRLPLRLSGGQQQRVAVARAMVSRPSIVLADEPTANLDSRTGAELLDMMRELNRKSSVTFIFSTHDEMVMRRANRVITLKDGRIAGDDLRD